MVVLDNYYRIGGGACTMKGNIGVCGCICSDCRIYETNCKGCHAIEGKACWLHEVGLSICDFMNAV